MELPLHPEQRVVKIQIGASVGASFGKHIVTFPENNSKTCTEDSLESLCAFQQALSPLLALVTISELPRKENEFGQELLSNRFGLPSWFWSLPSQEASGFFHTTYVQQIEESEAGAAGKFEEVRVSSRFLIKHHERALPAKVSERGNITYYWERFSFFYSRTQFEQFMLEDDVSLKPSSPFTPHAKALKYIVSRFDHAVWSWRNAVRECEEARSTPNKLDPEWVARMHEIARHVIHTSEMLEMALHVTHSLIDGADTLHRQRQFSGSNYLNESGDVKHSKTMLQCLLLRSQALEKRIQNELQLAFHRIAQQDSRTIQRDSLTTKTISVLGLLFLPGTFISAVFSMSFFNFTPGDSSRKGQWRVSEDFWVYWIVAVPVTIITVTSWSYWQRQIDKKSLPDGTVRETNIVEEV